MRRFAFWIRIWEAWHGWNALVNVELVMMEVVVDSSMVKGLVALVSDVHHSNEIERSVDQFEPQLRAWLLESWIVLELKSVENTGQIIELNRYC